MYHIDEFHDLSSLVFLVKYVHLGVEAAPVPHQVLPRPHNPRVFAAGPFTYDFCKDCPLCRQGRNNELVAHSIGHLSTELCQKFLLCYVTKVKSELMSGASAALD